ncbi:MAG: FadR family transcriptional regulator [Hyphomonadaceae bacterium]|nr:FadR family transcriptional regulator [Hyphomonadaceae bacterium]
MNTADHSYQKVAVRILELIETGVFPLGSRLPSEKQLSQNLGVGRASIRDAKIALQALGYLDLKASSGAYILEPLGQLAPNLPNVTPLELTEARALFEAEAAALAAPIITSETISELEKYIAIMAGNEQYDMTVDDADAAFHLAIARATNNHMIFYVVKSMWKIRNENKELQKVYRTVCDHDPSHLDDEHSSILNALKNRDPAGARLAMREHFNRIIEALIETSEKEAFMEVERKLSEKRSRFMLASQLN